MASTASKTSKPKTATAATKTATKAVKPAVAKPAAKPVKAAPAKPAAKPAPAKAAASKAAPAKAKAAKPKVAKPAVTPDQRRCYVEVAAYYMAERRGFSGGNPVDDWAKAEAEVDRLLTEGLINP